MAEVVDCYLQPSELGSKQALNSREDSGVSSMVSGGGQVNMTFLPSPDSDIVTSFSDEQKLSSTQHYMPPKPKDTEMEHKKQAMVNNQELGLPPPPRNLWLPISSQSHSADGIISYPGLPTNNYVHPSMFQQSLHPSVQSLPTTGAITPEEHQLLVRFRQEKLMKGYTSGSVSSPDADGPNVYEEVPAYLYRTHNNFNQVRLKQSPDGRVPPHLPPISSLPSSSQASGLDSIHKDIAINNNPARKKITNPLYDSNDSHMDEKRAPQLTGQAENKVYLEQSEYEGSAYPKHRCYCVTLILVTVLALAALTITLLTSFGILNMTIKADTTGSGASVGAVTGRLNSSDLQTNEFLTALQHNVSELAVKMQNQAELNDQLNRQVAALEKEKTQLQELINQTRLDLAIRATESNMEFSSLNSTLLSVDQNLLALTNNLGLVNSTLTQAVTEVSKEPGPPGANGTQGPRGFLDPSLCLYDKNSASHSGVSLENSTSKIYSSRITDTVQSKIIGASCTADGFKYAVLLVEDVTAGKKYQCECWVGAAVLKFCTIHYWRCTVPTS